MQLPRPSISTATTPSLSDAQSTITVTSQIAADIVRLQGEELIRVQKEFEKAQVCMSIGSHTISKYFWIVRVVVKTLISNNIIQNLNANAFELIRATDRRLSDMQNDLSQQRMWVSFLEGTVINFQRENGASSQSLRTIQKNLQNFLDLGVALGFEREQSSFLPQEGITAEYSDSQDTGNIEDSTKVRIYHRCFCI